MILLIKRLETRLNTWEPHIVNEVMEQVEQIIELADNDVLDIICPRNIEQEVLEIIDETDTR